jgi:hypothetical protein
MADRAFGVREINIVGSAGTPTISSPNNINLNGINVAISTDLQVGRNVSVVGVLTATTLYGDGSNLTGISGGGVGVGTTVISTESITVSGVSTFNSNVNMGGGVSPLQVYNGGQNILKSNSPLTIQGGGGSGPRLVLNNNTNIQLIPTTGNNGVLLYHGADLKLQTTNSGVSITGAVSLSNVSASSSVTAATFYGDGSGLTNLPGGGGSQAGIDTVGTSFFNTIHATGTIDIGTTNAGVAVTHMSIDTADVSGTIRNSIKSGAGNTNAVFDIETKEFLVTDPYAGKGALIAADSSGTKLFKDDSLKLQTIGTGVTVTGTMYATAFSGDGSALTGVPISGSSGSFVDLDAQSLVISGISTFNNDIKLALNVLNFGDNSEYLRAYINGGNSYLVSTGLRYDRASDFTFTNAAGSENFAVFVGNGTTATGVDLYGSNGVKLTTVGYGVSVTGTTNTDDLVVSGVGTFQNLAIPYDNAKLKIGVSSDIQIYHTGTASIYWDQYGLTKHHGSGWTWKNLADNKTAIDIQVNAGQKLYYDATRRFMTTNDGVHVAGIMTATSVSIGGTSAEPNLTITSDGTDSFIRELNSTGELTISTNQLKIENPSFETLARFNENSDVQLYFDNSEKIRTTNTGAVITGILTATSFVGNGSGLTNLPASYPTWTLGANGTLDYTFTGIGFTVTTNDPVLYLARGQKYAFDNQSGGTHPFEIRVADSGVAYNHGVTNNGASTGTIVFEVPFDAPNTLFYQCTSHSGMGNTIRVYPDLI